MSTLNSLRLCSSPDLNAYLDHLARHMSANGAPGELLYDPRPRTQVFDRDERRGPVLAAWSRPLTEMGWLRTWGLWEGKRMVGALGLQHRGIEANLHRAWLGMGIEAGFRKKGWGRQLVLMARDWAAAQPPLAWLDLGVFAHNEVARKFYLSMGFIETGRTVDAFRVDGVLIEDIQMSLQLRT